MCDFAIEVEHAFEVSIQRPQHADPRVQQRPRPSAAMIHASVAACHSAAFCSAAGNLMR
jgi:hypothetical protein